MEAKQRNKQRLEEALGEHGTRVLGATVMPIITGRMLYGFLDAALGKLKPADADAARDNALHWLRRQDTRAQGKTPS